MRTKRAASARAWLGARLLLAVAAGCGEAPQTGAPAAEPAPIATPRAFALHGAPGPWWRDGATQVHFDAESRSCLARSRDARAHTTPDARADAAYRAFLEC